MVIEEKVTLLQARVASAVPSKVMVPPLALNIGLPEMVTLPEMVIVPEVEVKVPAERVKASFISIVESPPLNVPPA